MQTSNYFDILKTKMDAYVHFAYKISKQFPKDETYGVTSQLRRSALSVVLNYAEGFAHRRPAVKFNFWEISYGSLKESKYLLNFSHKENYLSETDYKESGRKAEKILWRALEDIKRS